MKVTRTVLFAALFWPSIQFSGPAMAAVQAELPEDVNYFNDLSGDAWVKANTDEAVKHFEKWRASKGDERAREAGIVQFYAWRAEKPDMIDQIVSDGRLTETEVKVPSETETVKVTVKYEVPEVRGKWSEPVVWRRITPSAFEVWTPLEGRLFNTKGDVIAKAQPTRDNSQGRQWFGAFLPDGHWITTELHEGDGRVYIFDRKGRCTHEIKAGALLESNPAKVRGALPMIVPWARSTREGDTWLVRVGSEQGLGESLLEPDGTSRRRKKRETLWQLCQPRQLGVRLAGGICFYQAESDDGLLEMTSAQPGHGQGVGNPSYDIFPFDDRGDAHEGLGNIPSEGDVFGFWPRSHATHVFNGNRTWFFDAKRRYQGWIAGERVGDAADRKSMIFRMSDGRSVTVSPTLRAVRVERFELADGQTLLPLELHPDIGLGIFCKDSPPDPDGSRRTTTRDIMERSATIVLARWNVAGLKSRLRPLPIAGTLSQSPSNARTWAVTPAASPATL